MRELSQHAETLYKAIQAPDPANLIAARYSLEVIAREAGSLNPETRKLIHTAVDKLRRYYDHHPLAPRRQEALRISRFLMDLARGNLKARRA